MKLLKLNEDKSLKDYEKEWEEQKGYKTCDECGTRLNDKGTCPKCDDGEEDLNESVNDSEEFKSYAAAIERHKANGTEGELKNVITSAHNDLNKENRFTGSEFNRLCDLANLPDCKIATNEAYDPQEFNPDATGPIYDLNVEFYKDLDRAVQAKDWPAAAKEWVEIRRDMDQTINDNANKPFFKRIPKFFFTPHEHTLAAYRRRIPDEYIKEAESTIVECGTMKFTESLKRILTEDVSGGWAIFATDLATGKEYCAGVYDTENNAHYWAAMDEVSDKEYGYGQFKYRVEKVEEYTSDMAASANELNKLKIKNYDGFENDGTNTVSTIDANDKVVITDESVDNKTNCEESLVEKVTGNIAEEVHNIILQFIEDDDMIAAWNDGETVKKAVKDRLVKDGIIDSNDAEADSIIAAELHKDSIRDMVYAVRVDLGLNEKLSEEINKDVIAFLDVSASMIRFENLMVKEAKKINATKIYYFAETIGETRNNLKGSGTNYGAVIKFAENHPDDEIIVFTDEDAKFFMDKLKNEPNIELRFINHDSGSFSSTLTEDKKEFYFVEIVPGPNGKNEYERYVFSTLDDMKARVKEMGLKEEDIDSCGGCEIKELCEKLVLDPNYDSLAINEPKIYLPADNGLKLEVAIGAEKQEEDDWDIHVEVRNNGDFCFEVPSSNLADEINEIRNPRLTRLTYERAEELCDIIHDYFENIDQDDIYRTLVDVLKCNKASVEKFWKDNDMNESLDDTNIGLSGLQFKSKELVDEDDIVPEVKSIDYDDEFDLEFYN